ncbi:MAG: hypothetical protein ABWZ66_13415 [Pyrinomonadaceae bacterium]
MASFKFDIEDASDVEVSVREGGEVNLDDVKVVLVKGCVIEDADKTTKVFVIQGGTVENIDSAKKVDEASEKTQGIGSLDLGRNFNQILVMLLALIFGIGFLVVLHSNVQQGKLDFQTYVAGVLSIVSLLVGYKNVNNIKKE